jgi:adenosylhomocysteinase
LVDEFGIVYEYVSPRLKGNDLNQIGQSTSHLEAFFTKVGAAFPFRDPCTVLVLTHLLRDRPAFLSALGKIANISRVIAIPYSVEPEAEREVAQSYRVSRFTLEEMKHGEVLFDVCMNDIEASATPLGILEIGGYFAQVGNSLRTAHGRRFLGSVEDTEAGHRRYLEESPLNFPVVSVARSSLKRVEDTLIGPSVLFSVERFVRKMGHVLSGVEVGVLGYGKIGASVARAAAARGCRVLVYDVNPQKRLLALADGFRIPDRERLLKNAEIIIGATGVESLSRQDFHSLRDNVILASASSRKIEFDLDGLNQFEHRESGAVKGVKEYRISPTHKICLLYDGEPVNFVDGAVVGPLLALVQAEMILALRTLTNSQDSLGLLTVSDEEREALSHQWIAHFATVDGGLAMNMDI